MNPTVSVCITTYNHESFIAQAIDGVLMQETDFDYEIIIGEDDSSDNTREIVKKYNRLPFVSDVDPDLEAYATEKAIEGLFVLIADEEAEIRANPGARTTRLLRRVLGSLD